MGPRRDKKEQVLALARRAGVVSAREVRELGIHHEYLRRLCAEGLLVREAHAVYSLRDAAATADHSMVIVSKAAPKGVVCLLSALHFHGIGTQLPQAIWLAIPRGSAQPRVERPRVEIVRFSGESMTEGVEEHVLEGVSVRIYSPAKTVADCFKFRNKIGLDVALEALRQVLGEHRSAIGDLWRYAGICRVQRVMRPYMEALL